MARKAGKKPNQDALDKAVLQFGEAARNHSRFVRGVEGRYKSYRGTLEANTKAAGWTSKLHPPYAQHIIETGLASLIDDRLRFKVRPRHTLADAEARARARKGAEAHKIIFDWQLKRSKFSEIQRPLILQNAIAGMTAAKTYWMTREERRRHLVPVEEPLLNPETSEPIYNPFTGRMVTLPVLREKTVATTVYDGPTTEVVDVRDFLWHEAATSLEKSDYVIHRVWLHKDEIEDAYKAGQFGPDRGGWSKEDVFQLLGDNARSSADELGHREAELFSYDRTKDRIAVVEVWNNRTRMVTTFVSFGAGGALLAHRKFPFFHERPPFTVIVTQPELFMIPGISQVEKIEDLQRALWSTMNQRIDNLNLVNNAIFWFRPDIEDIDEYTFEPGARWPVEDPTQVQMWAPNPIPAEISLGAEALFKGDLQNLAGGFPFSSGAESQTVDQKTATGASIVTGLAQRSVNLAKSRIYEGISDIAEQRLILNQQFIREPMAVPVLGVDDEETLHEIWPEILAGDYTIEQEPAADALTQQEDQARAQAQLQLAAQVLPVLAPLSQNGLARMLNMDAFVEDFLKAFGVEDTERYFVSKPAPQVGGPGSPAGGPGAPEGPGGVTGPGSIDPAVSPSSQISQSPEVLLQRALAARGGGQNVPQ